MTKHYIRKDGSNTIIHAYSTAFEIFQTGDILIKDNAPRQYTLDILDENKRYKLKYVSGKIQNRTQAEIYPETKATFDTDQTKKANSVNTDTKELIDVLISKGTIAASDFPASLKTRHTNAN